MNLFCGFRNFRPKLRKYKLEDGPGSNLGNINQEATALFCGPLAANKCRGGIRTPSFLIVDDLCTTYKMDDWSTGFLSAYQTGIGKGRGKK
jgi:hypothetical protein